MKILSQIYNVKLVPASAGELAKSDGWCDTHRKMIYLDESLEGDHRKEILWHEIFHALYHEYAFPSRRSEEEMVTWLGRAVSDFVLHNATFVCENLL